MNASYHGDLALGESNLRSRVDAVQQRIQNAAGRSGRPASAITLVAVTKKFSAAIIRDAYSAGLRHFGENYVQEFAGKRPELSSLDHATFHLIGHLQSNKARLATELFQVIETIDSVKLLERLETVAAESGAPIEALIEVKLSDEASKTGAHPRDLPGLLAAAAARNRVRVTGLMTIPPWSEDAEQSRPYFRKLAALAREHGLPQLSMGMSNDFEAAIEEGATIVRV
ncbi:MAG: YggS family pyridoxal phosphate-dependent enzyme, partial [Acidobacteriaceae bacterium]|nr:YggS family pyridoxal phosphate-dependent enzyme [Acidobacteriaceae bacterium]